FQVDAAGEDSPGARPRQTSPSRRISERVGTITPPRAGGGGPSGAPHFQGDSYRCPGPATQGRGDQAHQLGGVGVARYGDALAAWRVGGARAPTGPRWWAVVDGDPPPQRSQQWC